MLVNQLFLSLFFLYFVLMSGECSEIINCNLQRYINNNNWIKHLMIFLSIYIFTFVLNWYTIESLIVENFNQNDKAKNKNNYPINKTSYLVKSLIYTIFIYTIFILSTKNEGQYACIFLIFSLLIVFGTIYTKSINTKIYEELLNYNFFIRNKDREHILEKYPNNRKDVNKIVLLQNCMFTGFIIIFLVLIFGCYRYYLRQYIDHTKKWSWVIFWFGYNRQCFLDN